MSAKYTTLEGSLINLLAKAASEYESLVRLEGPGSDGDKMKFCQGISVALDVINNRALRRADEKRGGVSDEH